MHRPVVLRAFALLIAAGLFVPDASCQTEAKPLPAGELLALVPGNALPENIVTVVNVDGLAFKPDNNYRAMLKMAGADATVLSALTSAKITGDQNAQDESGKDFLQVIECSNQPRIIRRELSRKLDRALVLGCRALRIPTRR